MDVPKVFQLVIAIEKAVAQYWVDRLRRVLVSLKERILWPVNVDLGCYETILDD